MTRPSDDEIQARVRMSIRCVANDPTKSDWAEIIADTNDFMTETEMKEFLLRATGNAICLAGIFVRVMADEFEFDVNEVLTTWFAAVDLIEMPDPE